MDYISKVTYPTLVRRGDSLEAIRFVYLIGYLEIILMHSS
jgi:hypothetical protein